MIAALAVSLICQTVKPEPVKLDYNVFMGGKNVGIAKMSISDFPDQSRNVLVEMNMQVGTQKVTITQQIMYQADGASTYLSQEVLAGANSRTVIAELSATGAKGTDSARLDSKEFNVDLSAKAPRSNPALFWFSRITPKLGTKISSYSFDLNDLTWKLITSEYLDAKPYKIGSQSIDAHHVTITRSGAVFHNWLDSKGRPLAMVQADGSKLERRLPASPPHE